MYAGHVAWTSRHGAFTRCVRRLPPHRFGRAWARSKALIHAHHVKLFSTAKEAICGQGAASKLRFGYVLPAMLSGARGGRRETRWSLLPGRLV